MKSILFISKQYNVYRSLSFMKSILFISFVQASFEGGFLGEVGTEVGDAGAMTSLCVFQE